MAPTLGGVFRWPLDGVACGDDSEVCTSGVARLMYLSGTSSEFSIADGRYQVIIRSSKLPFFIGKIADRVGLYENAIFGAASKARNHYRVGPIITENCNCN